MTRMTWEEFSQAFDEAFAELGITVLPETEPLSTTTFDVIMRPPRAESPDSSGETPDKRKTSPSNASRTGGLAEPRTPPRRAQGAR